MRWQSRWLPALLLTATFCADGSSLRVGPTLVTLDVRHPVATLRVTNNNPRVTAIEARVVSWRQLDNQDIYEESKELVATPPVFELEPGEMQIVRIGLLDRTPADPDGVERSFRVFISELPDQQTQRTAHIETLMRVGVPIFVRANARADEQASGDPTLHWSFGKRDAGEWSLEVSNIGKVHARIVNVTLQQADAAPGPELAGVYVLPGSGHSWSITAPKPMQPVTLRVALREGTRTVTLVPPQ